MSWIELRAADGFEISAWRADPSGEPRGGLVIVQEIFGVNEHIRSVADAYAADGYLVIAPNLFDRARKRLDLGYTPQERKIGFEMVGKIPRESMLMDIDAAIEAAKAGGKVGIVGYCLGGTLAWAAAARSGGLSAAVGYYGGGVIALKDLRPKAPVMLHFGEKDENIPQAGVREVAAAHPDVPVHLYSAGHAFNRYGNLAYDEPSASLARARTLEFLSRHLG